MSPRVGSEPEGLIPRAVREALDCAVVPAVRESLIKSALRVMGRKVVPSDPTLLRAFVDGPLRNALLDAVGQERCDAVALELERVIAAAATERPVPRRSDTPPRRPPPRTTTSRPRMHAVIPAEHVGFRTATTPLYPPVVKPVEPSSPPISSGPFPRGFAEALGLRGAVRSEPPSPTMRPQPTVLVFSLDADAPRRLAASVEARVAVIHIRTVFELVREVDASASSPVAVLVDCRTSGVRVESVAALAEDFPPNVTIVLWGSTTAMRASARGVSERTTSWLNVEQQASTAEIAECCTVLVG